MGEIVRIDEIDDPRLGPYRRLKERELGRDGGRFIAESEHVVRRLLASDFAVESVLVCRRREAALATAMVVRPLTPLYVVADVLINRVVGFKFHSGVIACGLRKAALPLEAVVAPARRRSVVVVCPDLISHENLGSIIRIAAAFGADGLLLGPRCCDPFYRFSIRVSMGTVFSLPMAQSEDLPADLRRLGDEFGYERVASVVGDDAEPLAGARRGERVALLLGNEAQGLDQATVAACDRRVTLPMREGVDSLNVAVAAGIFLYHFSQGAAG
jgi:tRNA G18 (ribose-2'-O)-methylase SpoU